MVNPGYKRTEIGILPTNWELALLTDKCELLNGLTYTPDNVQDNGLLVLRSSNIQNGQINLGDTVFVNCMVDKEKYVKKDDILICVRNGSAALIGKCAKADRDYYATFGAFMAVLRGQNNDFIFQLLQQGNIQKHINKNSESTINQITNADFKSIVIPWPSEADERETIATALSDIDALITNLEKLIAKKKAIKQGAMQELLTGKRRLPGFGGVWETVRLGDHCAVLRGGSPRPIQAYLTSSPQGANWIKIGDVREGDKYITATAERIIEAGISRSREVFVGDFILSNSMSFGRPYILKINGCIHDGWLVIQNYQDSFDQQYLYYVLGSDMVKSQYISMAAGSSVQNLNKEKVGNVMLHKPDIEEQHSIAAILSDMDEEISKYEHQLRKYKGVKQGMMSELLTGRIRLV